MEKSPTDAAMGRTPALTGRALDQYRDERLGKLEKLFQSLDTEIKTVTEATAQRLTGLETSINQIGATQQQYIKVLEGLGGKFDAMVAELQGHLEKVPQLVKLAIDDRLKAGGPSGSTGASGVGDRIFGKDGILDRILNRVADSPNLPFIGGGSSESNLDFDMNTLWKEVVRRKKMEFRNSLAADLGLPKVTAESVKITHQLPP